MSTKRETEENKVHPKESYDPEAGGSRTSISTLLCCWRWRKAGKGGGHGRKGEKKAKEWEKQFKPDAKIWALYLKDAEEEAKENTEVWKNGLDSLLIFAGLFAGVVSSFVTTIDSNGDAAVSSLWIKGLWATSLLVTLFSAVMGVLAKAWSVKFIPVSSKKEAKDAYQRRILDKRAKRWQLERVIKFIPLLIQISAFLFAAGFAVQSYVDNRRIGRLTTILASIGLGIYLIVTLIPVFYPSSPFETPLSDLFIFARELLLGSGDDEDDSDVWSEKETEGELADIWLNKLIRSAKIQQVDEAIAELTRQWPSLQPQWQNHFGDSVTPSIVVRRLRDFMIVGFNNKPEEYEEICCYFLSLQQLTHYYESLKEQDRSSLLCRALTDSLKPSGPLHRWNVFPETVRPLAFIPRTHLLIRGKLETIRPYPNASLIDVPLSEVEDRPWENMVHSVQSRHRLNFLIAACRGLVEGEKNLQTICSYILSTYIAKVSVDEPAIEWSGDINPDQKEKAEKSARRYVIKLFGIIARRWETMITVEAPDVPDIDIYQEFQKSYVMPEVVNVVDNVVSLLSHSDAVTRRHAIKAIHDFTQKSILSPTALERLIPKLAEVTLTDEDSVVRSEALELFMGLQRTDTTEINQIMTECTSMAVKNGLEGSRKVQSRILESLINMRSEFFIRRSPNLHSIPSPSPEPQKDNPGLFETFISGSATQLISMAMSKSLDNNVIRDAARTLLAELLAYEQYQDEIKATMRENFTSILQWEELSECLETLKFALELVQEYKSIRADMELWINIFIIDRIYDSSWFFRRSQISLLAEKWMGGCIQNKFIQDNFLTVLPAELESYESCVSDLQDCYSADQWRDVVINAHENRLQKEIKSERWQCRFGAVRFCQTASLIPDVLRAGVADDDSDVRSESLKVIKFLILNHDEFDMPLELIKANIVAHMDNIFEDNKDSWVDIIGLLAERTEFHEGVSELIKLAANSPYNEYREQARNVLLPIMSKNPQTINKEMIMQFHKADDLEGLINEFCDKPVPEEGLYWLELLTSLKDHPVIQEILPLLTPEKYKDEQFFQHFCNEVAATSDQSGVRVKLWVHALGYLAECSDIPDIAHFFMKIVRESDNEEVRSGAMKALATLALKGNYNSFIRDILKENPEYLSKRDEDVHRAWIDTLETLALRGDTEFAVQQVLRFAANENNIYSGPTCAKSISTLLRFINEQDNAKLSEFVKSLVSDISMPHDLNWTARIKWLQLYVRLTELKIHNRTVEVINFARNDEDEDVRREAIQSLITLLKNEEKLLDSIKGMVSGIKLPEVDTDWRVRMEWVELFTVLTQKKFQVSLNAILRMSVEDSDSDVRLSATTSLSSLLENDEKLRENFVKIITSKHIDSGLADQNWHVAVAWVNILGLLPQTNQELNTISRLADTSLNCDDDDVRNSAVKTILKLSIHDNKMNRDVATIITQKIESYLKDQEHKARSLAIDVITTVAGLNNDEFREYVISKATPHLLAIAVGEEGNHQSEAQYVFEQIKTKATDKMLRTIFSAVPSSLATVTTEGKDFLIPFFTTLKNQDFSSVSSAARSLVSVLKTGSRNAQGTAIELLSHIYSEYWKTFPQLIHDTISELILVALDDKRDNDDRVHALKMIILVLNGEMPKCFEEIKRNLAQFLSLLEQERIKGPAVELISLLAVDKNVRKAILTQAISRGTSKETQSFKGFVTLVSRLLLDKRLKDESIDYAMILLTCPLLTQPRLVHLRFQVISALWCYYRKNEDELNGIITADSELVRWFTFALFGRHATKTEVDTWCDMSDKWLPPDSPVVLPTSPENLDHSQGQAPKTNVFQQIEEWVRMRRTETNHI